MFISVNDVHINLKNVVSVKIEDSKIIFNYNYEISLNGRNISPDYTYVYMYNKQDIKELKEILEGENFITFEKSDNANCYVNLDNVSSIKEYIKNRGNYTKYRLIFNLCVGSTLKDDNVVTSSAVYYDFDFEEDFERASLSLIPILRGDK